MKKRYNLYMYLAFIRNIFFHHFIIKISNMAAWIRKPKSMRMKPISTLISWYDWSFQIFSRCFFCFPRQPASSTHTVSSQTSGWVWLDVQIIGSSGAMFALNSSLLLLYKNLQKDGRLSRVPVERVSLDKIPASLLSSLTTGTTGATHTNHNLTR